MSGEKKRLEQDLLQRRASNVFMVDPRFSRFQEEAIPIDRIRIIQSQQLAGQVPVTDSLKTQIKKTKRKAKRKKNLRGDLSQNLTAQRRFTRGERREKDTEEPRIVGDPAPAPTGFGVDPAIERRRLDLEEARERQRQLERVTDRRLERERYGDDLAFRRLELQARQADRAVLAGIPAAVAAALPAPAPIVIPPAAAPAINIAPAPINIAPAPVQVDVGGPVINLPDRADAPAGTAGAIPEIQRLGAELRADVNAFGAEQDDRNRDLFRQLREATELENRQVRETVEAIDARQQAQDENRRADLARQDAQNQEVQVRLGLGEAAIADARDVVVQEIRDAEGRLRGAQRELDRPTGFDDVILAADRERLDVDSPIPEEPEPEEPGGIGGVIVGGGELNLPNVVVEQPGRIGPDESLRLSPEQQARVYTRGTSGPAGGAGKPLVRQGQRAAAEVIGDVIGGAEERLGLDDTPRVAEEGVAQQAGADTPTPPTSEEGSQQSLQFQLDEDRLQLDPVEPVNVAETLRLSRLALDEAEPGLLEEEADEAEQQRLRLVDTQDFLAGFERPVSPRLSPVGGGSPLVGGGTAAGRLEELLAQPSPVSPRPRAAATPTPRPEEETPEQALAIFQQAQQLRQQDEEEEEEVGSDPRPGQVAQGIAQFGGAVQPAPNRVIEDAGIQAQPELRPLDPDVLFEPVEEAEVVGQVQDTRPQAIRDSYSLYQETIPELASNVRQGPQGARGQRGGIGYRIRNNTDKQLKKVQPGDVVNVTGVDAGADGRGRYRLDTEGTATGTRVGLDQLSPLLQSGDLLFERGNRHELGGHFDEQPYGPPPPPAGTAGAAAEGPGLLQQGAEAAGGAVAGVVGGAARLAGGAALGVGQGIYEQLPAAGDVGAALGRGAVAGVTGAGRLAAGAVAGALGGGEEEEAEEEP